MNTETNGWVIKKYFCVKIIRLVQNYLNFANPIEWDTDSTSIEIYINLKYWWQWNLPWEKLCHGLLTLITELHFLIPVISLQRLRNINYGGRDSVSNYQRLNCLLKRLFRFRSKKTSKLRVTGLCERNPPVAGGFPSQRASNAENASILWRHHGNPRWSCVIMLVVKAISPD